MNRENKFSERFKLLNSQEYYDEITWSLSENSDYENKQVEKAFENSNIRIKSRIKRKRKTKTPKHNLCNLILGVSNPLKERTGNGSRETSPILRTHADGNMLKTTPPLNAKPVSPILKSKIIESNTSSVSPIISQKYLSPTNRAKIRKNLYSEPNDKYHQINVQCEMRSKSPILMPTSKRKTNENYITTVNKSCGNIEVVSTPKVITNSQKVLCIIDSNKNFIPKAIANTKMFNISKVNDTDLTENVKSCFEHQFSSDSLSQLTISDSTPVSKSELNISNDIEIISSLTQATLKRSSSNSINAIIHNETNKSSLSKSPETITDYTKKTSYKKGGLSYRLNLLLKKQNANVSLWQHERYLAENTKFIAPMGQHAIFRIKNCICKYGCYVLHTLDCDNVEFIILINNNYLYDNNMREDMLIKIYQPYNILDFYDSAKLLINVCKFQCLDLL